jgi:hypothetical protein
MFLNGCVQARPRTFGISKQIEICFAQKSKRRKDHYSKWGRICASPSKTVTFINSSPLRLPLNQPITLLERHSEGQDIVRFEDWIGLLSVLYAGGRLCVPQIAMIAALSRKPANTLAGQTFNPDLYSRANNALTLTGKRW